MSGRRTSNAAPYMDEIVGKPVSIKFVVEDGVNEYFRGEIKGIKKMLLADGSWGDSEHYIIFDDGDERWFDLAEEEAAGRLRWETEEQEAEAEAVPVKEEDNDEVSLDELDVDEAEVVEDDDDEDFISEEEDDRKPAAVPSSGMKTSPAATPLPDSPASATRPVVVTPEKNKPKSARKPTAASVKPVAKHKKKKKPKQAKRAAESDAEVGVTAVVPADARVDYIKSQEICLIDFDYWLRNIHRSKKGELISKSNANSVIRQVRKFAAGEGTDYKHWPAGRWFYRGTKVNLKTNFSMMLHEAKDFETKYGKDKGNGWLMQHPIKKLDLYRPYARDIRKKKQNFLHFLVSTIRSDSPTNVVRGVADVLETIFAFTVREKVPPNESRPGE